MPRKPRVQYEGAAYHVMSRGNRGADIFTDDRDRLLFLDTLDEAAVRVAWEIHAFVLMRNHYHFLLVTPHANLVEGMKWLQGAFTQRINARHKWRGHLFQGRYRAQNIDPESSGGNYFQTVASYIHLNPARARLAGPNRKLKSLAAYRWSSFPLYLGWKAKRPEWLKVDAVLAEFDLKDDSRGRKRYGKYLEDRVIAESRPGAWEGEALEGKWCLGGDHFRDELLDRIEGLASKVKPGSLDGDGLREVGERRALALIEEGLAVLGLDGRELPGLRKSDPRKQGLAWLLRTQTTVPLEWVAERLVMGDVSCVSRGVGLFREGRDSEVRRIRKQLEEFSRIKD